MVMEDYVDGYTMDHITSRVPWRNIFSDTVKTYVCTLILITFFSSYPQSKFISVLVIKSCFHSGGKFALRQAYLIISKPNRQSLS
jgi:hypothetical protein